MGKDIGINDIARFYNEYHQGRLRETPVWMNDYWQQFLLPVLEVGGGTLIPIGEILNEYTGVDISMTAVKKSVLKGARYLLASGLALPFAERSFQTVACHDVLEHVFDPARLIKEMCRVSDRRIVIYGPNYVGTNFYKEKKDFLPRLAGVLSQQHHFLMELKSPHLIFDDNWESDADAVTATNIYWVKNILQENDYKIIQAITFLKKKWLNYLPLIKYTGSFMAVVAERRT